MPFLDLSFCIHKNTLKKCSSRNYDIQIMNFFHNFIFLTQKCPWQWQQLNCYIHNCVSNHCVNLSNVDSGQVLVKNVGQKSILSKLVIYSNLLNSTRKKLEWQEGVHGYLSKDLWQCDRTQNCVRGGDTKTNQRLAGTTQSGLPVILCQFWSSLLFEKSYCFVKALGWDRCGGSCVVNTSLGLIFVYVKTGKYFKTNFYIIWIDMPLLWQILLERLRKGVWKVSKTIFYEVIIMGII